MKKLIVLFLISIPAFLYAQENQPEFTSFNKGHHLVGIRLPGNLAQPLFFDGEKSFRYGYFLMDKLAIGVDFQHEFRKKYFSHTGVSPYIRYYLLKKKFTPFVEANYGWGQTRRLLGSDLSSTSSHSGFLGVGFAYTLLKHISLEAYSGYEIKKSQYTGSTSPNKFTNNGFTFGSRISFIF